MNIDLYKAVIFRDFIELRKMLENKSYMTKAFKQLQNITAGLESLKLMAEGAHVPLSDRFTALLKEINTLAILLKYADIKHEKISEHHDTIMKQFDKILKMFGDL